MKKNFYLLMLISLMGIMILSACGSSQPTAKSDESVPAPAEYADLENPLGSDAATAGKAVFDSKCATCHGESGKGDGPGGAALNPRPGDMTKLGAKSDGYIFWRISEGGTVDPFKTQGSLMPAWKNILSEKEIWQVVTYVRTLK